MKHRLQMTLGIVLLLLSLALAARGAGSVGAATMPTFALPPMAHFQLDASLEMDDRETTTRMRMTASGQGASIGRARRPSSRRNSSSRGPKPGCRSRKRSGCRSRS